ncbi:hypothetical protein RM572_21780 [Streptomyces sp. DSM 42041]|uniref:Uncharacterized protein n=1 Tax=Streptomyces hazeniae TaxID=3075538 RepID=A0ABU2NZK0_9ACTN|nr:hypothetical protein [Streptomyces sp. DSM 42041]MDT0381392.1 hypothetical protein [Streptomyces sp. DSM 42041]
MMIDNPSYGFIAPNGAGLTITPQPDGRPLVEVVAQDRHDTAVLLYLAAITAVRFAEDLDRAVEAAANGDTTVGVSDPRIDTAGDSIQVVPGPDDGIEPRVTISVEEHRGDPHGPASVAVEVPLNEAADMAAALRTAASGSAAARTQNGGGQ